MATETSWTSAGALEDTIRGLSEEPPWLSSLYFYDAHGSTLFDAITKTPEYYPTRTELSILKERATELVELVPSDAILAELGSGTSEKTRAILHALDGRRAPYRYVPIDVSAAFLEGVAKQLQAEHPLARVEPIAAEYGAGIRQVSAMKASRHVFLFLGSSIGNFEPEEQEALLASAYRSSKPGDLFILGTDMVKNATILDAAYNDAQGVTARFNLNLLAHLNAVLGAGANLDHWRHVAFYNEEKSRIEMHLEATQDTVLKFPGVPERSFAKGHRVHTENSYKFTPKRVDELAAAGGWKRIRSWYDEDHWFGLHVLVH